MQFSTDIRTGRSDQIESVIGTAPTLEIRSGAPPVNCAAADTGTLLATLVLPSDWLSGGGTPQKTIGGGPWALVGGAGAGAGTDAGHFRIKVGGACKIQGTCGESLTEMLLDNSNIAQGQAFNITAFTINEGNA